MRPNRERFDQSQLVEAKCIPPMQLIRGKNQIRLHPPILMYPDDPYFLTAIRLSRQTGVASPTIQIGLYTAPVAEFQSIDTLAQFEHFDPQFMSQHPWIRKKRLSSMKGMDICPTDPDSMHPHQRLARSGARLIDMPGFKLTGV
jgi:hypothetical protein